MIRNRLIASAAMATVLGFAGEAFALPQSPVIAGTNGASPGATFSTSTNSLTVTQTNSRVVIDWASFNIASGETVTFAQPSNTAIALNVVNATSFTTLDGALNANGGVWIFSPAGMLIGNGAAVNVGSFLASTAIAGTNTVNVFLGGGGPITFAAQPATANPSITVQPGASIDANAGFVELNSTSIVQGGAITASDSVDYSALPGGAIDFDTSSNGFKLNDLGATTVTQNQATSITHTGTTTAGGFVAFETFNDPSLGAPVSSVINLSGHVTANGLVSDSRTGSAYGVLLIADDTDSGVNSTFQIPASSATQINAAGSVITTSARIGAEAGAITTGDWTTTADLGGSGLNIQAGAGGLSVPGTLNFAGAGQATLSSLGPISITGAINSGDAVGLSLTGSSFAMTGSLAMSAGFLSISTPGALTINGPVTTAQEGASLIESGSSPVVLRASGPTEGDLGQNVSLTFTGTPDSGQSLTIGGTPYSLIFDQAELLSINNNLAGHYALATSIDLSGTIFGGAPIASRGSTPFTGTFTGLGNTISNLVVDDTISVPQTGTNGFTDDGFVGLFGSVGPSGVVSDVNLVNANVTGGASMAVGALAGASSGTLINDQSSGIVMVGNETPGVNGGAEAGGLVGGIAGGSISGSKSSATVIAGNAAYAGGLVGTVIGGSSITGSSATGAVSVGSGLVNVGGGAGGLIGIVSGYDSPGTTSPDPVTVTNSYATGAVSGAGSSFIGGFVGYLTEGQISGSYATGTVTQTQPGQAATGSNSAGGFAGDVYTGGVVTQSYASGDVTTQGGAVNTTYTFGGGFVGLAYDGASIANSYALGSVTSTGTAYSLLGGFVGDIVGPSTVAGVYATGAVSGAGGPVGGLAGYIDGGSLTNSYWDTTTSGLSDAYCCSSANGIGTTGNLVGLTTAQFYTASNFSNFTFGTSPGGSGWVIVDTDGTLNNAGGAAGGTRPMLLSEYSTTITDGHQLQLMALDPTANYILANNIDLSATASGSDVWNPATGFVPIAQSEVSDFTGGLDGAGHTISNLTIVDTAPINQIAFGGYALNGFVGLFGFLGPGGVAENLQISNANVTSGDGMAGGILSGALQGSAFNVSTSGSVTVGNGVTTALGAADAEGGGLAGTFDGLAVNASSSANISGGDAFVGGLIGSTGANAGLPGGIIYASHASGDVAVGGYTGAQSATAGGLVGVLFGYEFGGVNPIPVSVSTSYATGTVTGGGGSYIGGLAGVVEEGSVTDSYATGAVTQTAGGQNGDSSFAGGLVGVIVAQSTVDFSYASGAVTTVGGPSSSLYSFAGGFAGDIDSSVVEKSYSLGSVSSTGSAFGFYGGFAGITYDTQVPAQVQQVYATGLVSGPGFLGGLVGLLDPSTLANSYWDEGTTGQTSAVGVNNGGTIGAAGVGGSTGLSPYLASSYPAFGFSSTLGNNDWAIIPGETRPVLVAEFSPTITNAQQLELMSLDLSDNYTLAANIDASDTTSASGVWNPANGFVPVGGNGEGAFTGTFNGAGYTISNLTIIDTTPVAQTALESTLGVVGLFGYASGSTLENVNLANVSVTGGDGMRAGALVGVLAAGSVSDASSSGTVTIGSTTLNGGSTTYVASDGGLIGATSGSILNSSSSATVNANSGYAGGIVGSFFGPSIVDTHASGAVNTGSFNGVNTAAGALAGGLAGSLQSNGSATATVTASYATGPVTGGAGSLIGGFAAFVGGNATITGSYATGSVTQTAGGQNGQNNYIGGFAGYNGATINQSYASGAVTTVGGPAGLITEAGGFVGDNEGSIANAYATGAVSSSGASNSVLGGFAGFDDADGALSQVYATGPVSGSGVLEGLVGQVGNSTMTGATGGQISDSYWDEGTTSQTSGYTLNGTGAATNIVGTGGTTGINPFAQATYAGWDFTNTWSPPSAGFYPELYGASHVLSVTGGATTFTYGGYTAVTYDVLGLQGGDTASVLQGLATTINGTTTSSSGFYNVGDYGVSWGSATAAGASGAYRILYTPGSLTVTPLALTASLTGDVEKTYDGTTSATLAAPNYELNGVVSGDGVTLNDPTSGTYASQNAGAGIQVSVSGLALSGADASDYTVNGSASAAIGVIDPKALVASLTGAVEKTYDGTTSATLTGANYQLSGVIGGDSVTLNDPTSGTYANQNAGSNIEVSVSGLALTGAEASDYSVNSSASAAIGVIDAKAIVASLTGDVEKTYDGTTSATLTGANYQLSGVVGGDSVTLNDPNSGTYASQNAGADIQVSVTGLALTGAQAGDYTVNSSASASIGVIDPKALVASLTGTVEKTYDGTTSATLTGANYQLSGGVIGGDSVALNDPTSGTYGNQNAGSNIEVSVSGLALTGAEASDYTVNSSASAAIGVIDPKAIVASLVGTVEKPYDGTTSATLTGPNYQLSGVIAGDSVSLNDPTSGTYANAGPGTDIVVSVGGLAISGANAADYLVNGSASAPIGVISSSTASVIQVQIVTTPIAATLNELTDVTGAAASTDQSANNNQNPPPASDQNAGGPPASGEQATNSTQAGSGGGASGGGQAGAGAGQGSGQTAEGQNQEQNSDETSGGGQVASGQVASGQVASGQVASGQLATGEGGAGGAGAAQGGSGEVASSEGGSGQGEAQNSGQVSSGGPAASGVATNAPSPATGASDAAAAAEVAPASSASAQSDVFPVGRSAAAQHRSGDNSSVTGAGNDDLWKGADLGGGTSP